MSISEYRLVHFVPNPIAGARVAVAALLNAAGGVEVVRPESTPDADCLGSLRAATLLSAVRPCLERLADFSELPAELGPLFILGQVQQLPATDAPKELLARLLFPPVARAAVVHGPRSSTQGLRWLSRNGVSEKTIAKGFRPSVVGLRSEVKSVTHYVKGDSGLLLMEPVVCARKPSEVKDSISKAANRLRAADHVLGKSGYENGRSFVTYLLPGHVDEVLDFARGAVADFPEATVVNCESKVEAHDFTNRINSFAATLPLH